jgi:tetratricopeptide (TPR) repeat protein
VAGTEGPGLAWTLTNLGRMRLAEGRADEAESLFRRGLTIREKAFGPSHVEVALSLVRLAGLEVKRGRSDEAEGLARRALPILEGAGQEVELARCLDVVAQVEAQRGREAEAELMYRRVVEIRERVLPGDHPETVNVLDRYAGLLDKMGRGNEAGVTEDRAKMMRARLEGKGHRLSGRDTEAP